jgi:aldehyde:ferredoxin oxidoreductase
MIEEYYEVAGWDRATGIPTDEKLKALGIER